MKNILKPLALVAAAIILAGCGGGGGSSTGIAPTVSVSVSPSSASVAPGGTVSFTATITGTTNQSVYWSVQNGSSNGTVSPLTGSSTTYTAPNNPGIYSIIAASIADNTKTASVIVFVEAQDNTAVSVSPEGMAIRSGKTLTLTANKAVNWSVDGASVNGTVNPAQGTTTIYTAPNKDGVFTVRAARVTDPSNTASVDILVSSDLPPSPF